MGKISLLILALLAGCQNEPVNGSGAVGDPRFQAVLSSLKSEMESHDIPGASIAVVEGGRLTAAAGVGYKQRDAAETVTPQTRFRVASLSKMVLAATALRLVEEGKLDLQRPVTDYVPLTLASGFSPSAISVEQLLTHTSGLPDIGAADTCAVGVGQIAAWFAAQDAQPLWSPPGAVWNYCNRGFSTAGWVIEAASGERFEDAATERVLGPAGMTSATYDVTEAMAGDHAVGLHAGKLEAPDAYDCAATRPPSGVMATPSDYAHLAETLLAGGGAMLTAASVQAMTTGHVDTDQKPDGTEQYGYGMFVRDGYKGLHILHHSGEVTGWRTEIWIVPAQQFAVVLFYNADARSTSHLIERAVDVYLGLENVPGPDVHTPPADWTQYAGSYTDPIRFGAVQVALDGDQLHLSAPGFNDVPLTQSAGDTFDATLDGSTGTVTFYPGPNGPSSWLVTRQGVAARQ